MYTAFHRVLLFLLQTFESDAYVTQSYSFETQANEEKMDANESKAEEEAMNADESKAVVQETEITSEGTY